jgi:AcrR family transcriptional regulator
VVPQPTEQPPSCSPDADGDADAPADAELAPARRRDAARTRQALLDAARRRFARDGYAPTTVRDIANDAGVNVALISRYFESKEGLFQACLDTAGQAVSRSADDVVALAELARAVSRQVTGTASDGGPPDTLLLLLRSSGDERAEQSRMAALRSYSENLARLAGWTPGGPDPDQLLLRAQVVLAATMGITLLRHTGDLGPLTSAVEDDLVGPLGDLVGALLPVRPPA